MSLNNEQMLPTTVRSMRQMEDLLNAEDVVLAEIEDTINEIYQRIVFLREELVNEEWLETQLSRITGGVATVIKDPNRLFIDIAVNYGKLSGSGLLVTEFLEKWLPAHLAYGVTEEKTLGVENHHTFVWLNDEIMCLEQIVS